MAKFNLVAQLQIQSPRDVNRIVNQLKAQFANINVPVKITANTRGAKSASTAIGLVNTESIAATRSVNELGRTLGIAARRFGAISIATGTFLTLIRSFKNGVGEAIDFQRELNKIVQTTGASDKAIADLRSNVQGLAKDYGVSSQELVVAARTLAQAGFSAKVASGSLKILAQTDLAATFGTIQDTTEGSIALLQQFGREAIRTGTEIQFLEESLSAISDVSKAFAVESEDIISAIRKTGGSFEAAGGNINELIALFTSVRATTRESADTIATAFRTIFTRIQRVDTIDALRSLGIELQDAEGKFVGPLKAIEQLSTGLSVLDTKDFRFSQIVEELGGFRQIGKVIPLLKQFAVTQDALNVAQNASGGLAEDAAIAQRSLAVQISKVKQEFQALIEGFTESEVFKDLAIGSLQFAKALIKVANALEPILPLVASFAAIKLGQTLIPAVGSFSGITRRAQGGRIQKFATGGQVVPVALMPGEIALNKKQAQSIGYSRLEKLNKTQKFASGGFVGKVPGSGNSDSFRTMMEPGGYVLRKRAVQGMEQKFAEGGEVKDFGRRRGILDESSIGILLLEPDRIIKSVRATKSVSISSKDFKEDLIAKRAGLTDAPKKYQVFQHGINEEYQEGLSNTIRSTLIDGLANSINTTAELFKPEFEIKTPVVLNDPAVRTLFRKSVGEGTIGSIFEAMISSISNPKFDGGVSIQNRPFDFVGSIGAAARLFSEGADIPRYKDAKSTLASVKDLKTKVRDQIKIELSESRGNETRRDVDARMAQNASQSVESEDDVLLSKLRAKGKLSGAGLVEFLKQEKAIGSSVKLGSALSKLNTMGIIPKDTEIIRTKDGKETPGRIFQFAKGGMVPAMVMPGEQIYSKQDAQRIGYDKLNAVNGGLVPGVGNRDSVPVMMEPGQFVLNKQVTKKIQKFAKGGKVTRNVGYIDSDVLADPKNAAVVDPIMAALKIKTASDYKKHLMSIAVSKRKTGDLKKLTTVFGLPGAGKSTLAMGGPRSAQTDNASLRATNRFPILTPTDIDRADQIIEATASMNLQHINDYTRFSDKIHTLSTSTKEEMAELMKRRKTRDQQIMSGIDSTGFGRNAGTTTGAPVDSASIEALLLSELDKKKLSFLGVGSDFSLRRKSDSELPEVVKKKIGLLYGAFSPTTAGHTAVMKYAQEQGIKPEDFIAAVGVDTPAKAGDPHSQRTSIFPQEFRTKLAKMSFEGANITKATKDTFGFGIPSVFDIGEQGGRRKFIRPEMGSTAFVADKEQKAFAKYEKEGFKVQSLDRIDNISGTQVRDAVLSGRLDEIKNLVSPEAFRVLSENSENLRNRATILPEIFKRAEAKLEADLAPILGELEKYPKVLTPKIKKENPELQPIVEELRKKRDKIKSRAESLPSKYLSKLGQVFPDKYGLKAQEFAEGGIVNNAANLGKIKRAFVFDFDDTLAEIDTKGDNSFRNFFGERAGELIRSATATRYAAMARKRMQKGFDIHVLTARPQEEQTVTAIQEFMSKFIGGPAKSIIGVAQMFPDEREPGKRPGTTRKLPTSSKKAKILRQLAGTYSQIIFADDDQENVLAGKALEQEGLRIKTVMAKKAAGGKIPRFAKGGSVPAMVMPGEIYLDKKGVQGIPGGTKTLDKINNGEIVPGTGNRDSVFTHLEPGGYMLRKSASQGIQKFAAGGRVGIQKFVGGGSIIDLAAGGKKGAQAFKDAGQGGLDKILKIAPELVKILSQLGLSFEESQAAAIAYSRSLKAGATQQQAATDAAYSSKQISPVNSRVASQVKDIGQAETRQSFVGPLRPINTKDPKRAGISGDAIVEFEKIIRGLGATTDQVKKELLSYRVAILKGISVQDAVANSANRIPSSKKVDVKEPGLFSRATKYVGGKIDAQAKSFAADPAASANIGNVAQNFLFMGSALPGVISQFGFLEDKTANLVTQVSFATTSFYGIGGSVLSGFSGSLAKMDKKLAENGSKLGALGGATGIANIALLSLTAAFAATQYVVSRYKQQQEEVNKKTAEFLTILQDTGVGNLGEIQGSALNAASLGKKAENAQSLGLIGGAGGAVGGALAGAAIGSVVPLIGTAVGAAIGGVLGGASGAYFSAEAADDGLRRAERIAIEKSISVQFLATQATFEYTKAMNAATDANLQDVALANANAAAANALVQSYAKASQEFLTITAIKGNKELANNPGFLTSAVSSNVVKSEEDAAAAMKEFSQQLSGILPALRNNIGAAAAAEISKSTNVLSSDPGQFIKDIGLDSSIAQLRTILIAQKTNDISRLSKEEQPAAIAKATDEIVTSLFNQQKSIKDQIEAQNKNILTQNAAIAAKEKEIELILTTNAALGVLIDSSRAFAATQENISRVIALSTGSFESSFIPFIEAFDDLSNVGNPQDFAKIAQNAAKPLGKEGEKFATQVSSSAEAINKLKLGLTAQTLSNVANRSPLGLAAGDSAIKLSLQSILGDDLIAGIGPGLNKFLVETIKAQGGTGAITQETVDTVVKQFADNAQQFSNILKRSQETTNEYLKQYDQITKAQIESMNRELEFRAGFVAIQEKGLERLSAVFEGRLTSRDQDQLRNRREALRTRSAQVGLTGTGARAGDINSLANSLSFVQGRLREVANELGNTSLDTAQRKELNTEQALLSDSSAKLTKELTRLTDQSEKAADVMSQIEREAAKRSFVASQVEDFVLGTNEQRGNLNQVYRGAEQVALTGTFQGLPEEIRKSVGDFIGQLADLDKGGFADQVRRNAIFNDSVAAGINPRVASALADKASTSKEDILIQELRAISNTEMQAQSVLLASQQGNTMALNALAAPIDKLILSIEGSLTQALNNQVAEMARQTATNERLVAETQALIQQRAAQKEAEDNALKARITQENQGVVGGSIKSGVDEIARIIAKIINDEIIAQRESGSTAGDFTGIAAATGGYVSYRGKGGSMFKPKGSDTVPAMLTPGEYVIKRAAADKYGPDFLNAVNNGSFQPEGYANGGQVGGRKLSQSDMVYMNQKYMALSRQSLNTEPAKMVMAIQGFINELKGSGVKDSRLDRFVNILMNDQTRFARFANQRANTQPTIQDRLSERDAALADRRQSRIASAPRKVVAQQVDTIKAQYQEAYAKLSKERDDEVKRVASFGDKPDQKAIGEVYKRFNSRFAELESDRTNAYKNREAAIKLRKAQEEQVKKAKASSATVQPQPIQAPVVTQAPVETQTPANAPFSIKDGTDVTEMSNLFSSQSVDIKQIEQDKRREEIRQQSAAALEAATRYSNEYAERKAAQQKQKSDSARLLFSSQLSDRATVLRTDKIPAIIERKRKDQMDRESIARLRSLNAFKLAEKEIEDKIGFSKKFASGGMAKGSDTIPAMLTPGEYVMKSASVNKYGKDFMDSVNSGSLGSNNRKVAYKKDGGLIGGSSGRGSSGPVFNVSEISGVFNGFSNNLKGVLDGLVVRLPEAINTSIKGLTDTLSNITQGLSNIHMTHELNINGQISVPGLDIDAISQAITKSLGDYVGNMVREKLDAENKKFKAG